uniref:Uncharacterized protein n=1 Tax=Solanum tuberosum TaxID=4113 RepID=M1DUF9_SOLTU
MAKILTQLNILSKNVMGAGARSVNAVGVGCANPEEIKFEALYNEEVNFLANQGGAYRSNYPRQGDGSVESELKVQIEMARPKVVGIDMPPRQTRVKNFRQNTKATNRTKTDNEGKKPNANKRTNHRDPTIPSWRSGFFIAIHYI